MNNVIIGLMMTTQVLAQLTGQLPGSQRDEHGCVLDGGYQWCESHNECERPWITPCSDTYEVDTPPMSVIDPIPLYPVDPMPVDPVSAIPEGCATWFDGCNTCQVVNGEANVCTMMMCIVEGNKECLTYYSDSH